MERGPQDGQPAAPVYAQPNTNHVWHYLLLGTDRGQRVARMRVPLGILSFQMTQSEETRLVSLYVVPTRVFARLQRMNSSSLKESK